MCTWAPDRFGNENALAWVTDFRDSPEYHLILDALTVIEDSENQHLSAQYCAIAIAAAEIVAALKKAPDPRMNGKISECLMKLDMPVDAQLGQLASRAVLRIRTECKGCGGVAAGSVFMPALPMSGGLLGWELVLAIGRQELL